MSLLVSQLAISPKYIFVVLISLSYLIFFWKDRGFFTNLWKVFALAHIGIYLIALFLFIF